MQYANMTIQHDTITMQQGNMTIQHDTITMQHGNMIIQHDTITMQHGNMIIQHDTITMQYKSLQCSSRKATMIDLFNNKFYCIMAFKLITSFNAVLIVEVSPPPPIIG